ncbi:helix-turn-helix transcriptional regulator [Clostridium sp. 'deep sea']|uniref:helix-turn-helix transcriptional regulator n=1 Tax=Clostridium sp. 'deep sea' TaxID=2779445 RepID=UPI0018967A8F|nr:helix-turn-helix transcriptional regulator [Clostridium sp. 'deep sea']QOR34413.1 helix-turn-helix transcriptional regulator [Clostridium sp. 'deep sea']
MKRYWLVKFRKGLTQQEVAKKVGISQNFYSCIETGGRNPGVNTAKKIAAVLGFNWTLFY